MHIVLVSACEKRALKRTRAVLDSYAMRSGRGTWLTPMTREGLAELRAMLRRTATRQTSVACFRNDGRTKMTLLWIVGSKKNFGHDGFSPVATRSRRNKSFMPDWARKCAMLAGAAGHMHDLGKYGVFFQEKLEKPKPVADAVRHEWISLMLVRKLMEGAPWEEAWENIRADGARRYDDVRPFNGKLSNASDVLLYLIATHHRLPKEDGGNSIGTGNHVRNESHEPMTKHEPGADVMERVSKGIKKVKSLCERDDHLYWRAVAMVSRMALILADHSVSAEKKMHEDRKVYANTCREPTEGNSKKKKSRLNQGLDWHLNEVGKTASEMIFNMLSLAPPVLSHDTVERIGERSEGRYSWQNDAARVLAASARQEKAPHLVLNIASTGSGKTRMNCRAVCVLNENRDVRMATALNLRTLTLQTGDAYARQIGIGKDELTCVIGDRLTSKLYEYAKSSIKDETPLADDDENPVADEFDTLGEFEYHEAPEWLKKFTCRKPRLGAIIGSPILVSTVDFLISAGEPHRQGNHALAALRIMTSDLILDEIDGYDPKPLLCVLRLVMTSAMFGKNVVASSATLSRPVARLLWQAYAKGAKMRERLTGEGAFKTAVIDDLVAPQVEGHETAEEFMTMYEKHLSSLQKKLANGDTHKAPALQEVATKDSGGWREALRSAVMKMHDNNAWRDRKSGKRLSIGLVRMANVRPAIETAAHLAAAHLAEELPQARVACYHANHFYIQRWHIEKRLDELLTRKNGDDHILEDREIRGMLDDPSVKELMLIVVATPVEEIGRDHDFDWAIIEPSSTQSIVQTAGRVNRHRLKKVEKPNITIMQYNLREIDGENLVFHWPGLETQSQSQYKSHDLAELLDWDKISQVDARLRFGDHKFAKLDDESIERETKRIFANMTSTDKAEKLWMALDTYTKSKLRDDGGMTRIELTLKEPYDDAKSFMCKEEKSREDSTQRSVNVVPPVHNAWLSKSDKELVEMAKDIFGENDNDINRSMTACVIATRASEVCRSPSFGFFK